jgi:hypothetical protein
VPRKKPHVDSVGKIRAAWEQRTDPKSTERTAREIMDLCIP